MFIRRLLIDSTNLLTQPGVYKPNEFAQSLKFVLGQWAGYMTEKGGIAGSI